RPPGFSLLFSPICRGYRSYRFVEPVRRIVAPEGLVDGHQPRKQILGQLQMIEQAGAARQGLLHLLRQFELEVAVPRRRDLLARAEARWRLGMEHAAGHGARLVDAAGSAGLEERTRLAPQEVAVQRAIPGLLVGCSPGQLLVGQVRIKHASGVTCENQVSVFGTCLEPGIKGDELERLDAADEVAAAGGASPRASDPAVL